jgi:hypothetical protein
MEEEGGATSEWHEQFVRRLPRIGLGMPSVEERAVWDGRERRSGKERRTGRDRRHDIARRKRWARERGITLPPDEKTIPEWLIERRSGSDRRQHPLYQSRDETPPDELKSASA